MSADPETLDALARELAPTLVGLSEEQARQRITDADARLTIRFVGPSDAVTLEYRFGRVTAVVQDGIIVSATPG